MMAAIAAAFSPMQSRKGCGRSRPSAAIGVQAQGRPAARLSITLPLMPAPKLSGATVSRTRVEYLGQIVDVADCDNAIAAQPQQCLRHLAADQQALNIRTLLTHQRHDLADQPARRVLVRRVAEPADESEPTPPCKRRRDGLGADRPRHDVDVDPAHLLAQYVRLKTRMGDDRVGGRGRDALQQSHAIAQRCQFRTVFGGGLTGIAEVMQVRDAVDDAPSRKIMPGKRKIFRRVRDAMQVDRDRTCEPGDAARPRPIRRPAAGRISFPWLREAPPRSRRASGSPAAANVTS